MVLTFGKALWCKDLADHQVFLLLPWHNVPSLSPALDNNLPSRKNSRRADRHRQADVNACQLGKQNHLR